jgi:pheromone shutdown protein TraB
MSNGSDDPPTPGDAPNLPDPSNEEGDGSVRVVGTAHVSEESVREVEETIDEERPDIVAVELDEGRYRQMKGGTPDDLDPSDLLGGNTVFQFLAYWMLSYVQTRMGEKFDIEPGAELLAAVEAAEERGIGVALVDREINTTIQRFWARLTVVEKFRMLGGLAFGVTDPRIAGVTFGLAIGVILGPIIGLFGGSVGLTTGLLTQIGTGGLVALIVGYVGFEIGAATVGGDRGLIGAAGVGFAAGSVVTVSGLGVGLATSTLSPFIVSMVGSLALGLLTGLTVGTVVGVIVEALGIGLADDPDEDFEEFDPAELTDGDVVSAMMEEFRQFSPGGAEALIDERDAYIANQLVGLRDAGFHVVAVVGAGHREGIERYLESPETLPTIESLKGSVDEGGVPWGKVVGFGITAAFVGFFVLLAMAGVRNAQLLRLFAAWFLINGVLAAGLAKLAGARWSSAGVGGLVAWMTSINPLLAPGWFTGYMELRHLTVNVSDIGTLNELLSDETRPIRAILGDMLDVPLFRLIVVVAMTNVGSVVASVLFAAYVLPAFSASLDASVADLMVRGARRSAELIWGTVA